MSTSTAVHLGSLVKSQLLYQLSYAGAPVIVFAESSATCRRSHGRPPALLSKLLSNPKTVVKPHGVRKGQIARLCGRSALRKLGNARAREGTRLVGAKMPSRTLLRTDRRLWRRHGLPAQTNRKLGRGLPILAWRPLITSRRATTVRETPIPTAEQ